jgi:hypothetical protein
MMRVLLWTCVWLLVSAPAGAQTPQIDTGPAPLKVYLDCGGGGRGGGHGGGGCFEDYLRDEIDFVDFVQQP